MKLKFYIKDPNNKQRHIFNEVRDISSVGARYRIVERQAASLLALQAYDLVTASTATTTMREYESRVTPHTQEIAFYEL